MTARRVLSLSLFLLGLVSCSPAAPPTETTPLPPIVTIVRATSLPPTPSLAASPPPATPPSQCRDAALFLEDITIPDNTRLAPGEAFTKTWKLRNTGTCPWGEGYRLVFAEGERMGSPDSVSIPATGIGESTEVSVRLLAPSTDGTYTAFFELRNASDAAIPVGRIDRIWVTIIVGVEPTATTQNTSSTNTCSYDENASYVDQLLALINQARAENGLPALTPNAQLTAAAQSHAVDMACNSLLSHTGSDGSSVAERIAAQGYSAAYLVENIYAGGGPQDAMSWWMNDPPHREAILNPQVTEIGIGYAYVAGSTYGDYFTVDLAAPG